MDNQPEGNGSEVPRWIGHGTTSKIGRQIEVNIFNKHQHYISLKQGLVEQL